VIHRVLATCATLVGEEVLVSPSKGEERIGRGLGHARRVGALAVSLATANAWDRHSIQITVRTLPPNAAPMEEQAAEVHHAAHPRHVNEHRERMLLFDVDRLRVQLAITAPPARVCVAL
jgi:hypothetical protein